MSAIETNHTTFGSQPQVAKVIFINTKDGGLRQSLVNGIVGKIVQLAE